MILRLSLSTLSFVFSIYLVAKSPNPKNLPAKKKNIDVNSLLKKMDTLFRQDSSVGEISMTIENPKWPNKRSIALKSWSKGQDYTLIKILSPKKDKGIGTLKRQKEMWNYFPKIARQIKIPASMMMGSWMGSDFTNDDLVRDSSYTDDFKTTATEKDNVYTLTLTPKKQTISIWDKIEMTIDKKTLLPLAYAFYNEKGEKIRTLSFESPKKFSGVLIPSKLIMASHVTKGKKTTVEYTKIDFNQKLTEGFFSFQSLKKENP